LIVAKHVLVAEDARNIAMSLAFLLNRAGVDASVESDGPAALSAVIADPPAVLVLDVMLPGLTGYPA